MAKKKIDTEAVVQLFKEADVPVRHIAKRTTVNDRKALLLQALRDKDPEKVAQLTVTMAGFMQKVLQPLGEEAILEQDSADHLISVLVDAHRDIEEFMKVVWDEGKRIAFNHLDAKLAEDGEKTPAAINASIESPRLGLKLCREGAGVGEPAIDHDVLMEILGDRWQEVYTERTIPATVAYDLDLDKLRQLAYDEPDNAWLEKIRPALTPGELKNAMMKLRNMNA